MSAHRVRYDEELSDDLFPQPDPGSGRPLFRGEGILPLTLVATGETNTLGDPDRPGITLVLISVNFTGGATRIITVASLINAAGNKTITFTAKNQTLILKSVPCDTTTSANKCRWQVWQNDAVTLSA